MKRLLFWICCIAALPLWATENNLAPTVKVIFNLPPMGDSNAFSLLGEFGRKNIRGSGTYGVYINRCNRLKFTGELLLQDLRYHFNDGSQKKWVTQYAVGGAYQYLFLHDLVQSIDFSAAFAHAFSRNVTTTSVFPARIASTDAVLSSLGSTINLWDCGYFSYALNYDYVKYLRRYENKRLSSGFGASLNYLQYIPHDFTLDLSAEFRRPFYYYSGLLNWHHDFLKWGLDCGVYVNYTNGRRGVPNALVGGLQLGFTFGSDSKRCCRSAPSQQTPSFTNRCQTDAFCSLSTWAASPAIYMPMVLAIKDQQSCQAPTSTAIPNQTVSTNFSFATAPYFTSLTPLTFSASGLPATAAINPSSGIISGLGVASGTYTVTVTASNACGSTSQTFTLTI